MGLYRFVLRGPNPIGRTTRPCEYQLRISHSFSNAAIQAAIEVPSTQPCKDAYAFVGGLDKQIEIIRDLLEIPLTRPELFRIFGCYFPGQNP